MFGKSLFSHGQALFVLRMRNRVRRTFSLSLRNINLIWALPLVFIIRALRPWKLIRLGSIRADRIGHFVQDACEQKARLKTQQPNVIDLFWVPERTSNAQWRAMICRELPVARYIKYVDVWNRKLAGGAAHSRPSTYTDSRDMEGFYNRYELGFKFSYEEDRQARRWLSKIGFNERDEYVCLLVRDSSYLDECPELGSDHTVERKWAYHDYRDSDIASYEPAIQWLVNKGIWVFRMGRVMKKPVSLNHPKIVDYAFRTDQSDLLDVWLFANCKFCISTSSGPDSIAAIYRSPILYLNATPLGHLMSYWDSLWTPKNLSWEQTGHALRLSEYLKHTFFSSHRYREANISIKDLSSAEILEGVQEFWNRRYGVWHETEEDKLRQKKFWRAFENWDCYDQFHQWIHPRSDISTSWLRRQQDDFFD